MADADQKELDDPMTLWDHLLSQRIRMLMKLVVVVITEEQGDTIQMMVEPHW